MASNAQVWLSALTADVEVAKQDLDRTLYLFGLKVIQRLVLLSPVDTGHFKRNWKVSLNFPKTGEIEGVDPEGFLVLGEAEESLQAIMRVPYVSNIWFTNNTSYAYDLEMGYSRKAPQGMIGITKPLLPYYIQEAAAEAKQNAR